MVKLLLGHGAKGNAPSATSNTPLHAACVGGHLAIAQVLLAAGANPNEIDKDGCHPLHWVAREGSTEVSERPNFWGQVPRRAGGAG